MEFLLHLLGFAFRISIFYVLKLQKLLTVMDSKELADTLLHVVATHNMENKW